MRMILTAPAAITAADTDARILRGVAIPYGQRGYTSAGPVTIDAGAIRLPENMRTIKLFREHGRQTPLGYATDAQDSPEQLNMEFRVARTPDGDMALLEASEGLRDALSVELNDVHVESGHVTSAELVAVAQVAVPAFAGAQLTATLTDEEQAQVNDLAQQIVDATAPAEEQPPAEDPAATATTEQETPPMTAAAAPALLTMTPPAAGRRDSARERRIVCARIAEAMRGATDAGQVNAALNDITPSTGGTDDVFPRPQWIGELWSPEAPARAIVTTIGTSPLTGMKVQGWKWVNKPVVGPYAGNKTDVPSSPAQIGPAEADAYRIAGGWDLDRIYVDFNTGFVDAFMRAATQDYRKKSQTYFIDGHAAVVGPPAIPAVDGILADATDLGAQASLLVAISEITSFLVTQGANVSFLVMAGDLFADFLALDAASVPWWLQRQGTVDLNGSTDVAGVTVAVDPGMTAGSIAGGDRDAVSLYETGPINVQAINIPQGGVDLALFGYQAQQVHDPTGLAKATVTPAP